MHLYLMRHGETDWNTKGRIQGSADIPLNNNGIELAEKTRDGLKNAGISFDKIYSSPFIRAVKTAEIIADGTCPVETDKRIQEMSFGIYEGISLKEVIENPAYENLHNFFVAPKKYKAENGCESYEEAVERVGSFCTETLFPAAESECKKSLVVCHGAILRAFFAYLCNMDLDKLWELDLPNCSINIFDMKNGQAKLLETSKIFFDTSLLPARKYT